MRSTLRLVLLLAGVLLVGCAGDSTVSVRSVAEPVVDAPRLPTAVYSTSDRNTADIYLTDLPMTALDPGTPLDGISGRIVHVHVFIVPRAGHTPIESSACSITLRHIVLAEGEVGIYSGGGFFLPSGRVGRRELSGRVKDATLRLTARTDGFADRLGAAVLSATIKAERNESLAKRIGARVDDVLHRSQPLNGN
jgi:hypothetical protein